MFTTNFTTLDWAIVSAYLVLIAGAGIIANRFIHNIGNYLVGGRASGTALNTATYVGGFTALVSVVYSAQDGFTQGFTYMMVGLIAMIVSGFFGVTGAVIKHLRRLELTTIPEYFEQRYNRRVRILAAAICALAGILNMGLFPKMGATFITYSTGLADQYADPTILVNLVTSILIVLVLLYTVLGGMVSVIITDFMQFIVTAIGVGIGLYYCLTHAELGWDAMTGAVAERHGDKGFNPFHPDSYGWVFMIWMTWHWAAAAIAWIPEATRALTAENPEVSRRTFLYGTPAWFVSMAVPALWGIAAFTVFSADTELSAYFLPEDAQLQGERAAQAMPLLMGKIVPGGLLGILMAGMMATFMSTHDSYFLCWASIIVHDVIGPIRKRPLASIEQIRMTRFIIIGIGVFLLIFGVWVDIPNSVWHYMAVTGTMSLSGTAAILVGGIYWKRASSTGAIAALLSGMVSLVALAENPIREAIPWIPKGGIGLSIYVFSAIVFVVFSLLFPDRHGNATTEGDG